MKINETSSTWETIDLNSNFKSFYDKNTLLEVLPSPQMGTVSFCLPGKVSLWVEREYSLINGILTLFEPDSRCSPCLVIDFRYTPYVVSCDWNAMEISKNSQSLFDLCIFRAQKESFIVINLCPCDNFISNNFIYSSSVNFQLRSSIQGEGAKFAQDLSRHVAYGKNLFYSRDTTFHQFIQLTFNRLVVESEDFQKQYLADAREGGTSPLDTVCGISGLFKSINDTSVKSKPFNENNESLFSNSFSFGSPTSNGRTGVLRGPQAMLAFTGRGRQTLADLPIAEVDFLQDCQTGDLVLVLGEVRIESNQFDGLNFPIKSKFIPGCLVNELQPPIRPVIHVGIVVRDKQLTGDGESVYIAHVNPLLIAKNKHYSLLIEQNNINAQLFDEDLMNACEMVPWDIAAQTFEEFANVVQNASDLKRTLGNNSRRDLNILKEAGNIPNSASATTSECFQLVWRPLILSKSASQISTMLNWIQQHATVRRDTVRFGEKEGKILRNLLMENDTSKKSSLMDNEDSLKPLKIKVSSPNTTNYLQLLKKSIVAFSVSDHSLSSSSSFASSDADSEGEFIERERTTSESKKKNYFGYDDYRTSSSLIANSKVLLQRNWSGRFLSGCYESLGLIRQSISSKEEQRKGGLEHFRMGREIQGWIGQKGCYLMAGRIIAEFVGTRNPE